MDKSTHLATTTEFGRISISARTIAQIVGRVTAENYGIVARVDVIIDDARRS